MLAKISSRRGCSFITMAVRLLCSALQKALPRAPPQREQTVHDAAILHTTLARLVRLPEATQQGRSRGRVLKGPGADGSLAALQAALSRISAALCGLRASLPNLWYVEEQDLLALALNGRYRRHVLPLQCQKPPPDLSNAERLRLAAEQHFPISQRASV